MKKMFFIASMMLATVCAQAQLRVNENGNVTINTTETPVSNLSIGYAGNPTYKVSVTSTDFGLYARRMGSPTYTSDQWTSASTGMNIPNGSKFYIGVRGGARTSGTNDMDAGRAYGVFGEAGNTTNGYNYGVYGQINGDQNGAAIFGTLDPYDAYVPGRYAGYFAGDIKVTGFIDGVVLSAGASANAVSTQVVLATDAISTSSSVTSKLTQLLPVQYHLETPIMTASLEGDTATTVHTMSAIEIQRFQKPHYGLVASELREVLPELVYEGQNGELCINYIEMIPLLVESIKELKAEIATLQSGNNGGIVVMSRAIGDATSVKEATALTIPMLKQNNPNPFTENTVIEYTLPESVQTANIYIYDMNGSQIEQITLTERGESSITVNGGQLSAGMYLYSLIADGKVIDTKRMILTK